VWEQFSLSAVPRRKSSFDRCRWNSRNCFTVCSTYLFGQTSRPGEKLLIHGGNKRHWDDGIAEWLRLGAAAYTARAAKWYEKIDLLKNWISGMVHYNYTKEAFAKKVLKDGENRFILDYVGCWITPKKNSKSSLIKSSVYINGMKAWISPLIFATIMSRIDLDGKLFLKPQICRSKTQISAKEGWRANICARIHQKTDSSIIYKIPTGKRRWRHRLMEKQRSYWEDLIDKWITGKCK